MTIYRANRLPHHTGPAAWSAILPGQPAPMVLEENLTADLAVIGGGFAGLSAARHFLALNPGARVVVLEAGRIAEGAAGRNSGFMVDLPHELTSDDYAGGLETDKKLIHLNRMAINFAQSAVEEYGIDQNYVDHCGKVNGAVGDAGDHHNRSYADHLDALGEAYEMLDAQAMFDMTGSHYYSSGLLTPGTAVLQPAGYVRGVAAGLRRQAGVYENSPVLSFERSAKDWKLNAPKGSVTAHKVILATNGHLESFGFKERRLMHIILYASMTPDLDSDTLRKLGGHSRWGITPSDPMGTTMRRIDTAQGGNRVVTRTCADFRPNMETGPMALRRAARVHRRKFEDRFPQLAGMKMEYSWAGHLCLAHNGVSVMEELDDGIFAACVQNGLGTTRGTMTGMGAAELACGQTSAITDYFGPSEQPTKLPPEPFATIGANAFLRYREWRAGGE